MTCHCGGRLVYNRPLSKLIQYLRIIRKIRCDDNSKNSIRNAILMISSYSWRPNDLTWLRCDFVFLKSFSKMCFVLFQVHLLRPLEQEQILKLMTDLHVVRPHLGANVREMTITGFHIVPIVDEPHNPRILQDPSTHPCSRYEAERNPRHPMRNEPKTVTLGVLQAIEITCPSLQKLVIRNCWLELPNDAYANIPDTLETLEFEGCR